MLLETRKIVGQCGCREAKTQVVLGSRLIKSDANNFGLRYDTYMGCWCAGQVLSYPGEYLSSFQKPLNAAFFISETYSSRPSRSYIRLCLSFRCVSSNTTSPSTPLQDFRHVHSRRFALLRGGHRKSDTATTADVVIRASHICLALLHTL